MTWKASGNTDLPLGNRKREWDEDAARERIFRWAGWEDDPRPAKARKAFFAYDDEKETNLTAYKLPFADVVDGELKAMPRGLFAVAQLLRGARDGIDLPEDVLRSVRRKVTAYYEKMGEEAPWKEPGGEKAMPGTLSPAKRGKRVKAARAAAKTRRARGTQRTGARAKTAQARKKRTRAARTAAETRRRQTA